MARRHKAMANESEQANTTRWGGMPRRPRLDSYQLTFHFEALRAKTNRDRVLKVINSEAVY